MVLDETRLFYYSLLDLHPLAKLGLVAALVGLAALYNALAWRVEKVWLELKFIVEEEKRADTNAPPWWKGWRWNWKEGVDDFIVPLLKEEARQRRELQAAWERQQEAIELARRAQAELNERVERGEFVGADELASYEAGRLNASAVEEGRTSES